MPMGSDSNPAAVPLERRLAALSAHEMVAALRLDRAPHPVHRVARLAFRGVSTPLGRVLARFDARIEASGMAAAAVHALRDLGATFTRVGEAPPARGPLLLVSNHPGAYDALVLIAALGRDDVALVAADRLFLRAMPALARHLVFFREGADAVRDRARSLREARRHLARGGALVQFGAGRIEPDPAFPLPRGGAWLSPWPPGTGALVRAAAAAEGHVLAARVSGVHSPRAKRLLVTRLAEGRGITTLAPLLQVAVPGLRDVRARVTLDRPTLARTLVTLGSDASITAEVRARVLSLAPR